MRVIYADNEVELHIISIESYKKGAWHSAPPKYTTLTPSRLSKLSLYIASILHN